MQGCPLAIHVSVQRLLGTCTRTGPLPSRTKLRSRSIVSARKTAIELHRDNLDAARLGRPSPARRRTALVVRATVIVTEELDRVITSLRSSVAHSLVSGFARRRRAPGELFDSIAMLVERHRLTHVEPDPRPGASVEPCATCLVTRCGGVCDFDLLGLGFGFRLGSGVGVGVGVVVGLPLFLIRVRGRGTGRGRVRPTSVLD